LYESVSDGVVVGFSRPGDLSGADEKRGQTTYDAYPFPGSRDRSFGHGRRCRFVAERRSAWHDP
jgi:hypothetical protein